MRTPLVFFACLLLPAVVAAQAPLSPAGSLRLARAHYAAGEIEDARRVLREARRDSPSVLGLRRWAARLEEEAVSSAPQAVLQFVPDPAPISRVSSESLDRALSPANQMQTAAYALYGVGVPLLVAGVGLGVPALLIAESGGCLTTCWGSSSRNSSTSLYAGLLLGGAGVGFVLSMLASWLDDEADRRAAEIRRRTFGFEIAVTTGGASVQMDGTF